MVQQRVLHVVLQQVADLEAGGVVLGQHVHLAVVGGWTVLGCPEGRYSRGNAAFQGVALPYVKLFCYFCGKYISWQAHPK